MFTLGVRADIPIVVQQFCAVYSTESQNFGPTIVILAGYVGID